jgi:hypothetical protein
MTEDEKQLIKQIKYCPLMSAGPTMVPCLHGDCAMWSNLYGCCLVVAALQVYINKEMK